MTNEALALERGKWWLYFIRGDLDAVRACLAPDVVRIGPRMRDANFKQYGRDEYINYMRALLETMPRLGESVMHDIVVSPDNRRVYLHQTEVDSTEPYSTEKVVSVSAVIISHLNDDGLVSLIDIYWREPEVDYEWTGTE